MVDNLYIFILTDVYRGSWRYNSSSRSNSSRGSSNSNIEGGVVGGDAATTPIAAAQLASAALLPRAAAGDVRARITSESMISWTISQTKIHGYHLTKQD